MSSIVCFFGFTLTLGLLRAELAPEVVERIRQSVVKVDYPHTFGTGFLINDEGLVLTSAHVVPEGGEMARIYFADGTRGEARFVSFAPSGADVALLQMLQMPQGRTFLEVGDPEQMRVGQAVYTVGYPYPVYPALIGSGILGHHRTSHGILIYDAPISSGSSGGPVLNRDGQVLGVISSQLMDGTFDSIYGGGFNSAIDAAALHDFLEAYAQGERETIRTGHVEYLRLPIRRIEIGQAIEGVLNEESDQLLESMEYADGYTVDLTGGDQYRISMTSDEVDAYLLLYDSGASLVEENDDASSDTTDAAIIFSPERDERFTIVATTFDRDEVGTYTLLVEAFRFVNERVVEQTFTEDSPTWENGKHYFDLTLMGRDATVSVLMESDDVDSYLYLYDDEDRVVEFNDDWRAGTFDARIVTTLSADSTYRIRATTFGTGETGTFTLTIGWQEDQP